MSDRIHPRPPMSEVLCTVLGANRAGEPVFAQVKSNEPMNKAFLVRLAAQLTFMAEQWGVIDEGSTAEEEPLPSEGEDGPAPEPADERG